ncbi:MAG TPA: ankyrin repeat domain-containing protein [Hyphomonadaceae bacterium]|nr:ankyrin repeat domain-containing protein [Hyphomonadaceae bacterium]
MRSGNLLETLIVGHLWQSVAVAAVLAGALIWGKRMQGATRYTLSGIAFLVCLALPVAAFIPGETLATVLLKKLDAPVGVTVGAAAAKPVIPQPAAPAANASPEFTRPQWADIAISNGAPPAAIDLSTSLLRSVASSGAPASETDWGKEAIKGGAPAWALNLAQTAINTAAAPTPPSAPPAQPVIKVTAKPQKPLFTLPEIKLPDVDLSAFVLPLLMMWAAGALFLLVRTARDLIAVERLVARAKPAELPEALKRRMAGVRVKTSPEAPGPMAAGLFRPCIVLPESIALGSPGMAALLEHERAHIERRDMLMALGQRVMLALLWWSPAMHWISRRIDEEREVACDEAAVERTGDPKAFARSLTSQAENQLWARAPRMAVGAIGPKSQVGRRIKRLIVMAKTGVHPSKYAGRLAFAGLALAVAVAAMMTPRFAAEAQQAPLAGGPKKPVDITKPEDRQSPAARLGQDKSRDPRNAARDAARARGDLDNYDPLDGLSDSDLQGLGDEIRDLMKSVGADIRASFKDVSPEVDNELAGLSADLAGLGVDISGAVSQQVLSDIPRIMEEVRQALKEQGVDADNLSDLHTMTEEQRQELRDQLQDVRDQLREQLGPEMKEQIRAAVEQARAEVAAHRDEIAAAVKESRAGAEQARAAVEQARKEIEAARARGDFDRLKDLDKLNFNYDFHFDPAQIEAIKEAAKAGAKWNKVAIKWEKFGRDDVEATAGWRLMQAASRGEPDAVKRLVAQEHPNVNAIFDGDGTPLIQAARSGSTGAMLALIQAGADPNKASRGDGNPLINAAAHGHIDAAKLLLEHGADVNGYVRGDETPLINAARKGDLAMVKLLVERGANVNLAYRADGRLRSPLNTALRYGANDVAAYLRSKGATEEPQPAN